jgi:hypothetical protein
MGKHKRKQSGPSQFIKKVEFARRQGFSQPYVSRLLRDGIIHAGGDGLIDYDQAVRDLEQNRDPSRPRRSKGAAAGAGSAFAVGSQSHGLLRVKIVRETFLAKSAQLDYERSIKKLIDANDVKALWFEKARTLRDMLINLKDRLPTMVAKRNEATCRKIVDTEVDGILKRLMKELHAVDS